MPRTIAIGDIHGMLDPLVELVDTLRVTPEDTLVFLGDLVDKGPKSPEVVRYIRTLSEEGIAKVVLEKGNHEGKHQRWRKKVNDGDRAGAMAMKRGEEIEQITAGLSQADIEFLDSAVLFHRANGYLFIHAGVPGDLTAIPDTVGEVAALPGKARKKLELLTFTRYIDCESGRMLPLGEEKDDDPFWADEYDGRFGRVVFGHQPWKDGPRYFPNAIGIDTGAVHGFGLTALVIEGGKESTVTIPTQQFADFYPEE